MTEPLVTVAELALLWLVTFTVVYAICACVINPIERWWGRRRQAQDRRAALERELARIDREGAESVQRIHAAFVSAQRQLRDVSAQRTRP